MKLQVSKYKLELTGLAAGLIAGWCYWYFVGCATGTCAITSKPINSALYGGVMGILIFGMFKKKK
ncbi:MAG: DUF6132 family protein [Flavipsychrobacter sp.]|nr:DUF6132 family protein [Flavipsychrobacter sp.]